MALQEIRAAFICDGCGRAFSVDVEAPGEIPAGWSCFDIAVDSVRGSVSYRGPLTPEGFGGSSSVQGDRHLCGYCTSKADGRDD